MLKIVCEKVVTKLCVREMCVKKWAAPRLEPSDFLA